MKIFKMVSHIHRFDEHIININLKFAFEYFFDEVLAYGLDINL